MKTLSIKQPWASLIVEPDNLKPGFGIKPIENRTWATKYRGRILIHAAAKPIKLAFEVCGQATVREIAMATSLNHAEENDLFGCIIGSVEIVDCVINHESIWAEKLEPKYLTTEIGRELKVKPIYNWVLENPILFPEPIPAKGKLSFWDYPNILSEPEKKDGELFCHCQLPVNERMQVTGDSRFGYYCRYCGGKWYK